MKTILLLLSVTLFSTLHSQTLLYSETFETDGEGTRYTSNTFTDCPNSDIFFRTNTNPVTPPSCAAQFSTVLTSLQGSFFWASEDIIGSSGTCIGCRPAGQITTQSFSIASYGSLTVSLYLATSANSGTRWENSDSINIQASINGGPFKTFGRFLGKNPTPLVGDHLGIDANLNGFFDSGVDPAANCDAANFTQYTFNIAGSGSTMRIRIDFDQAGGTEELAIDQIEVRGTFTLPLMLRGFNAGLQNDKVITTWTTANEENTSHFEIERSGDGRTFAAIGNVSAMNTVANNNYSFIDNSPLNGNSYYRLRMVDRDSKFSYSTVIRIVNDKNSSLLLAYPNPVKDVLNISSNKKQEVFIADISGKILQREMLQAGNNPVNANNIPKGVYLIKTKEGKVIKWIKQ